MRSAIAVGLALLSLSAACGSDYGYSSEPTPTTRVIGSVVVNATSADALTALGDTRDITASVKYPNGALVPSPDVSWRSSDAAIATVSATGNSATITAVGNGTAIIYASSGGVESNVGVTVRQRVASIVLSAPITNLAVGASTQLSVTGLDPRGHPTPALPGVTYTSENTSSVIVSPQGVVTAIRSVIAPFSSVVTATVIRDGVELIASKLFTVVGAAPTIPLAFALRGGRSN
jgi:trimeric autotransporter adhesin